MASFKYTVDTMSSFSNILPVAIIGGGLAGLSAAVVLEERGIPYILYEAKDRLGGRVYPVPHGAGYLQLGAESIDGNGSEMFRIAKKMDIAVKEERFFWYPNTKTSFQLGAEYAIEDILEFLQFANEVEDSCFDYGGIKLGSDSAAKTIEENNVAFAFGPHYKKFLETHNDPNKKELYDKLADLFLASFTLEWSAPADKLALNNFDQWDDMSDGKAYTLDRRGYRAILDHIILKVDKTRIRLSTVVENIDYSGSQAVIKLASGESELYDHVIVCVPLGFLKKNEDTFFTPKLPDEKKQAIRDTGFGDMMKVFIMYDSPWWDKGIEFIVTIPNKPSILSPYIKVVQPLSWDPKVLVIWVIGNGVNIINQRSDTELMRLITEHLKSCTRRSDIPLPIGIRKMNWRYDKFTLGSYSFMTPESIQNGNVPFEILAKPILGKDGKRVISFAGEHTHPTMYQTASGAADSGKREALLLCKKIHRNVNLVTPSDMSKL